MRTPKCSLLPVWLTAIIVAFLGRLHPVGIFFAGILMAGSYLGRNCSD